MSARTSLRRVLTPVLIVAMAALAACGEHTSADSQPARKADTAVPMKGNLQALSDSIASHKMERTPIDSAFLGPLPALAKAQPSVAADTIPLHAPNGDPARYGVRSGRIVQRFTGNSRGERRITFDDYGMRERREENMAPYPEGTKGGLNNVIVITTASDMAYADVRTKRGWRTPNEGMKRYMEMGASKTMSLGETIMSQSGAERLPDTVIAGYHCRTYRKQVQGMTITDWIWRGIVIREHMVSPQDNVEYTAEPVEITPNIDVPPATFTFPSDYQINPYAPGQTPGSK